MKSKIMVIFMVAIFAAGFGKVYADVDTPEIIIPVSAEVVEPTVSVTEYSEGLNFGQILPHLTDERFVKIDVRTVLPTDNVSDAQTAADGAEVYEDAAMENELSDPGEVLLGGITRTAGLFTLTTDIPASVTIEFADDLTLTSNSQTMEVTDIRDNSNPTGLSTNAIELDPGVPKNFHIGGVLNVSGGQSAGTYENTADNGLKVTIALE
ncbi:MAG: DUF4402 domain-containing protein [Bacillota bacterium]